jgi:hypothetical protein
MSLLLEGLSSPLLVTEPREVFHSPRVLLSLWICYSILLELISGLEAIVLPSSSRPPPWISFCEVPVSMAVPTFK